MMMGPAALSRARPSSTAGPLSPLGAGTGHIVLGRVSSVVQRTRDSGTRSSSTRATAAGMTTKCKAANGSSNRLTSLNGATNLRGRDHNRSHRRRTGRRIFGPGALVSGIHHAGQHDRRPPPPRQGSRSTAVSTTHGPATPDTLHYVRDEVLAVKLPHDVSGATLLTGLRRMGYCASRRRNAANTMK